MSFVMVGPEALAAAASDLTNLGSTLGAANAAAAAQTTGLLAAGADEVSGAIAALFGAYGQGYQSLSAQAAVSAVAYEPAPPLKAWTNCW